MSTELAVATERGQSMAELMGVSSTPSRVYSLDLTFRNVASTYHG